MKTFYTNKLANNHVNEYINEDGEHYSDLISYTTRVASFNFNTKQLSIYGWYSNTTMKHINSFLEFYGFDRITKKDIVNKTLILNR